ncbi:MAG: GxxExxY protein [Candidatus Ratteibacteria bacterium]|nr:GxxExxY protein [Candidatus Ratteibacteria bacterium]
MKKTTETTEKKIKILCVLKKKNFLFLTYLRATEKRVGLPLNFNVERLKDGIKRMVL